MRRTRCRGRARLDGQPRRGDDLRDRLALVRTSSRRPGGTSYTRRHLLGGQNRAISHAPDNRTPVANAEATPTPGGPAARGRLLDSAGTEDPDGDELLYEWDFGDGIDLLLGQFHPRRRDRRQVHGQADGQLRRGVQRERLGRDPRRQLAAHGGDRRPRGGLDVRGRAERAAARLGHAPPRRRLGDLRPQGGTWSSTT